MAQPIFYIFKHEKPASRIGPHQAHGRHATLHSTIHHQKRDTQKTDGLGNASLACMAKDDKLAMMS
jgi:hypothetical protein